MKCLLVLFVLYVVHDHRGSYEEGENVYHIGRIKYIAAAVYAEKGLTLYECVKRILEFERFDLTEGETGVTIEPEYARAVGKDENERKDSK